MRDTTTELSLPGDYVIDPDHSRIGFAARHAMVTKVRGSFGEFTGTARVGADPADSATEMHIRAASITTNQKQRDDHVRGSDFLDVATHPEITFRSTGVQSADPDAYVIDGDLTICGVTRPVSVEFAFTGMAKDPAGAVRAGFEGATTIKRSDFGITFNPMMETGGVMVSDRIALEFDISAVKQL